MTDYPIRPSHNLMTERNLDQLTADAANWRKLLADLAERGFDNMNVEAIAGCFPNFRAMAHDPRLLDVVGDHGEDADQPEPAPQAPRDAFLAPRTFVPQSQCPPAPPGLEDCDQGINLSRVLDAYLTPSMPRPTKDSTAVFQRTKPVAVQEFAEAETNLGPVTVGYTTDSQIAFHFVRTNKVFLIPITDLLSEVMKGIVQRKIDYAERASPTRLM